MKIKSQTIALIILGFVGLTAGMLFSSSEVDYLFSRSIGNSTEIASTLPPEEIQKIKDQVISLRKQLVEETNNADKALEIRKKIQELEKQLPTENAGE